MELRKIKRKDQERKHSKTQLFLAGYGFVILLVLIGIGIWFLFFR